MDKRSLEEVEASTEKLLRDLKAVVHDGEELLKAGARDLSARGRAARERLSAALEMAKDTQHRLQSSALSSVRATDDFIRAHPYESLGVAFGIGLLVGALSRRR